MANRAQIECVTKSDRYNPYERITHVGGSSPTPWRISQDDAIRHIESGAWEFFVSAGRSTARVIVAVSRFGHKYLKTEADGEQPDNLLSLRECASAKATA